MVEVGVYMPKAILSLFVLSVLLVGCQQQLQLQLPVLQQQSQEEEKQEQVPESEAEVARLLADVAQASSARIRVKADAQSDAECHFVLKAAELQQLKRVLAHTKVVPPPVQDAEQPRTVGWMFFRNLELLDAEGVVLRSVSLTPRSWMSESECKKLAPDRVRAVYEPRWYLPDADYKVLKALPVMKRIDSWAERQDHLYLIDI